MKTNLVLAPSVEGSDYGQLSLQTQLGKCHLYASRDLRMLAATPARGGQLLEQGEGQAAHTRTLCVVAAGAEMAGLGGACISKGSYSATC